MNTAKFISDTKQILQRLDGLKTSNKVKALRIYLDWEAKYEPHYPEIIKNMELWDLYTDVLHESSKISQSLIQKEIHEYAKMLPD